jgi:hypothetical protein
MSFELIETKEFKAARYQVVLIECDLDGSDTDRDWTLVVFDGMSSEILITFRVTPSTAKRLNRYSQYFLYPRDHEDWELARKKLEAFTHSEARTKMEADKSKKFVYLSFLTTEERREAISLVKDDAATIQ